MKVHHVTPILSVSDLAQSFAWFEKLGWKKSWDWGTPPDFGAVCCGDAEIFLCLGGQGSRRTCRGTRARCTCATPTATCSA